jgi:hypothetical protein
LFSLLAEASYAEYEYLVLDRPGISLKHPFQLRTKSASPLPPHEESYEQKKDASRVRRSLPRLSKYLPVKYFSDVTRSAKYKIYLSPPDVILFPSATLGSVSLVASQMLPEQENQYWQKLTLVCEKEKSDDDFFFLT